MIDDTRAQRSKHRTRDGCNGLPFNKRGPKAKQTEEEEKNTKRVPPEEEERKPEKGVQVEAETLKKTKRVQLVLPEERQTVKTARVQ